MGQRLSHDATRCPVAAGQGRPGLGSVPLSSLERLPARVVGLGLARANFYRWSSPRESVRRHAIASRVIVVDLAELAFIDSTGVRALFVSCRDARTAGSTLTFARPSEAIVGTLERYGVLQILPLEPELT
jgi:anti-anti-sigma factor